MHEEIDAYDAKTKWLECLRRIETGESITNREKAMYAIDSLLKMTKRTVSDDVLPTLKGSDR